MSNNKIDITEVVKKANKQLMLELDKRSINITGCDIDCTLIYSTLFRNNEGNQHGRNRLSLKDYCKQKDLNHMCIYSIIQDGVKDKDGEIILDGLKWFEKVNDSADFIMTRKGMSEIYGAHGTQIHTPIMTVNNGSIYIDDTHSYFSDVFDVVMSHPSFDDCGGYNEEFKSRELMFSRNELKLAKNAGIILGTKGIEDGTTKSEND